MSDVKSIQKIDIHAHASLFSQYCPSLYANDPNTKLISPEALIEMYDRLGVEKGILLPLYGPEKAMLSVPNENCKYMSDKYPDRLLWFCNIDPRLETNKSQDPYEEFVQLINHYKALGAKGVGEITAHLDADDPRWDPLFRACEDCDMPVTLHIASVRGGVYGLYDDLGLPRLEKLLQKYPKLKFLGHSKPLWAEISGDLTEETRRGCPKSMVVEGGRLVELFRKYPNLYGDLSAGSGSNAMMRDPDFTERFIAEFADRLMYGCDICVATNTFVFKFRDFLDDMLDKGKISEENYRKIARENAIRILKLDL